MSERTRVLLACSFLALCALVALPGLTHRREHPPRAPQAPPDAGPGTTSTPDLVARHGRHDPALPVRDAFEPPTAAAPPHAHRVSLVYLSAGRSLAVVDERVVTVGERLAAGTVVEIRSEGVLVRGRQGTWLYRLGDASTPPLDSRSSSGTAPQDQR